MLTVQSRAMELEGLSYRGVWLDCLGEKHSGLVTVEIQVLQDLMWLAKERKAASDLVDLMVCSVTDLMMTL